MSSGSEWGSSHERDEEPEEGMRGGVKRGPFSWLRPDDRHQRGLTPMLLACRTARVVSKA